MKRHLLPAAFLTGLWAFGFTMPTAAAREPTATEIVAVVVATGKCLAEEGEISSVEAEERANRALDNFVKSGRLTEKQVTTILMNENFEGEVWAVVENFGGCRGVLEQQKR